MAEEKKFYVSVSPHVRDGMDVSKIMGSVLLALAPTALWALYLFGLSGALIIGMTVFAAMFTEVLWHRVRDHDRVKGLYPYIGAVLALLVAMAVAPATQPALAWLVMLALAAGVYDHTHSRKAAGKYATDWSAAVTGLLLAMCLPPKTEWWIAFIGGAVAIALGKEIFGGLGFNIFNPALVSRAILLMSWPSLMTSTWFKNLGIDGSTSATPLALAKDKLIKDVGAYYTPLAFRNTGGSIGEVSAVLLLLGGLYLIWKEIIDWRIPATYVGTVALLALVMKADPLFSVLAGGVMVGAFFMATDYVTSCSSNNGKIIFGIGCGLITMVLRHYSGAAEAVTGAILFMNMLTPLIDRSVQPRLFGVVKEAKAR
ncbi:MAG: RnfABCDGE type electron transport complex subunit D [Bacillota bacterium]|nr:RnfABCDGE type electron transport complex subunit D [Bacillota bacterium]